MGNGKYDAADLSAQQTDNSTVVKSVLDEQHDFYFSEKQRNIQNATQVQRDGPLIQCLYRGIEYTEACLAGSDSKCRWDDAVYLGSGSLMADVTTRST